MRLLFMAVFLMIPIYSINGFSMWLDCLGIGSNDVLEPANQEMANLGKEDPEVKRKKRALRASRCDAYVKNPYVLSRLTKWKRMVKNAKCVQDFLVCPLSGEPFIDPVIATDGFAYERKHLITWLKDHEEKVKPSPMTGEPLRIIRINLGIPPQKQSGKWRIKPKNKLAYFVTDATLQHALTLYKSGHAQGNEAKLFFDPLNPNSLLEEPTVFGDGLSYSAESISLYFGETQEKGYIKNPFHEGPGSEYFHEFVTVEYVPSPLSGEEIRWDQKIEHQTIAAIVAFLDKEAKIRAFEKQQQKYSEFRRMRTCRVYQF